MRSSLLYVIMCNPDFTCPKSLRQVSRNVSVCLHWMDWCEKDMKRSIACTFRIISGSCAYKYCGESFLFSLVNLSGSKPTKMPLTGTSNQNGIYCHSGYGPTFGGNHDLHIANGANANANSYTNIGHTYQCPANGNSSFLVGQRNFSVDEVEVFAFKAN